LSSSISDLDWKVINPNNDLTWEITPTSGNGINNLSAFINSFNYESVGFKDLLASPVLDFSQTLQAALFFRVSYANRQFGEESLKIFVSRDCELSLTTEVYSKSGSLLAVTSQENEWIPTTKADWRKEFVNLNAFAGEDQVRIAFEVTNGNGNNIYLDDIELFVSDDSDPLIFDETTVNIFPNPSATGSFKITFNLNEKEDIFISVFDRMGKEAFQNFFPNTLNQTYDFDLKGNSAGIYFLKISGQQINTVRRIFINN